MMYFRLFLLALALLSCATNSGNDNLSTPTGLKVISSLDQRVTLAWNINADIDVNAYEIEYGTHSENLDLRKEVLGRTSNSITITGLTNNQIHFFRLRSIGENELKSEYTASVSATPKAVDPVDVSIVTWNVEWFHNSSFGPTDDSQQYDRVKNIINSYSFDLIGLQEVSNESKFNALDAELSSYSAAISQSNYQDDAQNIALLYKNSRFTKLSEKRLSTIGYVASRPPLEVKLKKDDTGLEFYVIVIHAKASSDQSSYDKRVDISNNLMNYLSTSRSSDYVILLGDFNDKMIGSITNGESSPYQNFVNSSAFNTISSSLNSGSQSEHSLPGFGNTIDHIILSDEFTSSFIKDGSLNILEDELRSLYPDYTATVSDHFPVNLILKL